MFNFLKKEKPQDLPEIPSIDAVDPYPNPPLNQAPLDLNNAEMGRLAPAGHPPRPPPNRNPNFTQAPMPNYPHNKQFPPMQQPHMAPTPLPPPSGMPPMPQQPLDSLPPLPKMEPLPPPAELNPVEDLPVPPPPPEDRDQVSLLTEDVEEIVNNIIEDKWEKINTELDRLKDWKKDIDKQVKSLAVSQDKLSKQVTDTQKAVISKVNDYNHTLQDVNAELKAMGKVFSKVMPVFTDNVKQLSKIVKKAK